MGCYLRADAFHVTAYFSNDMHWSSALTRALTEPGRRAGVNANAGAGGGRSGSKRESSPVDDMVHDTAFDSAPMPLVSAFARLLLAVLLSIVDSFHNLWTLSIICIRVPTRKQIVNQVWFEASQPMPTA